MFSYPILSSFCVHMSPPVSPPHFTRIEKLIVGSYEALQEYLMQIILMDNCISMLLFSGEVYILASSKSMAQSHSGKLYKLVDPKR